MEARDLLIDAFGRISEEVHLAAEGLPTEALNWRPDPDANSIAWLVWHLTRVQDDHVSHLVGIDQAYVVDGWADRLGLVPDVRDLGYGHTSAQVGAVVVESPEVLLAYFDAVHGRTCEYLATVDATELDRICDTRLGSAGDGGGQIGQRPQRLLPTRRPGSLSAGDVRAEVATVKSELDPDIIVQARRFGWEYEHQGRVALTGAGASHAGEISGGMLGRSYSGQSKATRTDSLISEGTQGTSERT